MHVVVGLLPCMLLDDVACLHVERNMLVGASYLDIEDLPPCVTHHEAPQDSSPGPSPCTIVTDKPSEGKKPNIKREAQQAAEAHATPLFSRQFDRHI